MELPPSNQKDSEPAPKELKKAKVIVQPQNGRSLSLGTKKEDPPTFALIQNQQQQFSRQVVAGAVTSGSMKRKHVSNGSFNQVVAQPLKKESIKRQESPKSRRQLLSNLVAPQLRGERNSAAQMMNNLLYPGTQQIVPAPSSELTYFPGGAANDPGKLLQLPIKLASQQFKSQQQKLKTQKLKPSDFQVHMFNRTGPIKILNKQPAAAQEEPLNVTDIVDLD